jgi:hypothetical protein
MGVNKTKSLPHFDSLDDLVDFFENNDLGDYWDDMPEVDFEIDIQTTTHLFALEDELLEDLTKIARSKHIASNKLINLWLKEKLAEQLTS